MTGRHGTHRNADCGSATLWTVAVALVVMMSTAVVSLIAIAISARHRVATAADLAALAAASVLVSAQAGDSIGTSASEQACQVARDVADANGARLSECQINGSIVDVLTTVTVPAIGYLGEHSVSARARAGPS